MVNDGQGWLVLLDVHHLSVREIPGPNVMDLVRCSLEAIKNEHFFLVVVFDTIVVNIEMEVGRACRGYFFLLCTIDALFEDPSVSNSEWYRTVSVCTNTCVHTQICAHTGRYVYMYHLNTYLFHVLQYNT